MKKIFLAIFAFFYTTLFSCSFAQLLEQGAINEIRSDQEIQNRGIETESVIAFVTELCQEGYAGVEGSDLECRSICVTAQGAIEEALAKLLETKQIQSVIALFVTPLPTTPLRKENETLGLSNIPFEPARQYTLDMRESTLRHLRDSGAQIIAVYSKERYEELKGLSDEGSIKQVRVWEKERKHPQVFGLPIDHVPQELVGACYLITDASGFQYYLPTQGIQAKDAGKEKAIWKKWLFPKNKVCEGQHRAEQMFNLSAELFFSGRYISQ